LDESTSIFAPKFCLDTLVHVHTHSSPAIATIVGIPTYDRPHTYTVAFLDGSISEYTEEIFSRQAARAERLLDFHMFGCPVFIRDLSLQPGHEIPKWQSRAC
jgi:hypothetical protein